MDNYIAHGNNITTRATQTSFWLALVFLFQNVLRSILHCNRVGIYSHVSDLFTILQERKLSCRTQDMPCSFVGSDLRNSKVHTASQRGFSFKEFSSLQYLRAKMSYHIPWLSSIGLDRGIISPFGDKYLQGTPRLTVDLSDCIGRRVLYECERGSGDPPGWEAEDRKGDTDSRWSEGDAATNCSKGYCFAE